MKIVKALATLMVFGVASNASAIEYKISGDFNNRFMLYTDQATLYSASETIAGATTAANPTNAGSIPAF